MATPNILPFYIGQNVFWVAIHDDRGLAIEKSVILLKVALVTNESCS